MKQPHEESPVNPLPPVVAAICVTVFVIEVIFQLGQRGLAGGSGSVSWRRDALLQYGFSDVAFDRMLELWIWDSDALLRMMTYSFVHYNMVQVLFVCVLVLALGKWVGEFLSQWAILAVFLMSAVFGAAVYGSLLDTAYVLVGGFPGAYGLIGAFTFLLWARLAETGGPRGRAFLLIGTLVAIQLAFGLVGSFLTGASEINRDWVADLAGFAAGFGATVFVGPGGWTHVKERLRQR